MFLMLAELLSSSLVGLVPNFILLIWGELSSALSPPTGHPSFASDALQAANNESKRVGNIHCVLTEKGEHAAAAAVFYCCFSDVTHWQELKCKPCLALQHLLLGQVPQEVLKQIPP